MKTTRNLKKCVQSLVGAASVALVLPVTALEKPAENAPKKQANDAAAADQKAAAPVKKLAMLGVGGNQVSETLSAHLGLAQGTGITIYHVIPGSAAAKAGIEVHDIITGLNNQNVGNQEDLRAAVLAHKPGAEVTVALIHKGKPVEKKVILGERVEMPQLGGAVMPGGAGDLMKMLEGMGANIPEADRKRMEQQMRKQFEQLRGEMGQNGAMELDLNNMKKGGGIQILGGTSVTIQDNEGSVTLKTVNGKKEVIVRDKDGETTFEGPYETEQDKAAVPDDMSDRIKRVDMDINGNGMQLRLRPGGFGPPAAPDEDGE